MISFFLSFHFSTVKKKNGVCQKISAHCVGFHSTCASVGAHPRSFLCTNKKEKGGHFFLSLLCRRRGWFHCFPICATLVKTLFLKLRHFSCFIILVFFFPVQHKEETKKAQGGRWMNGRKKKRKTFEKCGLRLQLSQRFKKWGKQIDIVTIKTDGRGLGVEFYYSGSLKFKTRLIFG